MNKQERAREKPELIAELLRSRIVNEKLADGASLGRVADLVAEYGVTRSSLREALRILEGEGLVAVARGPGGGVQVRQPDARGTARNVALLLQFRDTSLRDVQDARIIIEPVVVRILASRRHRRASATELRGLIATQRALDDIVEFGRANAAFHNRIISLAGNQTLSIMADVLNEIVERAIAALGESRGILSAAARRRSLRSQEHLVELIEAGAAEEAESHWRRHLENAARRHPEGLGTKIVELLDHD